jgi:two-component system response regulator YesN
MKVLIVDDEASVHEQLETVIPWEALGWSIVGHCYNGEEARQLALALRPQLIITDIRMPMMDGLSLMEWLKESDVQAEVIVLSGYGDFEYSRPAFLYGAFDYMLKPINGAELLKVLGRAVDKIHRASDALSLQIKEKAVLQNGLTVMQDEFMTSVVDSSEIDENELIVSAAELSIPLPEAAYTTVVVKLFELDERIHERYEGDRSVFYFAARNIMKETFAGADAAVVFRPLSKSNEFVVLYAGAARDAERLQTLVGKLHRALVRYLKVKVKIGLSSCKTRISRLPESYREGALALESMLLNERDSVGAYSSGDGAAAISQSPIWQEIGRLLGTLLDFGALRDGELLKQKIEEAFSEQQLSVISGQELKHAVSVLLDKIEGKAPGSEVALLVGEGKTRLSELKLPQIKALLQRIVDRMLEQSENDTRTKSGKQLIEVICGYVQEHYRTVNLEDISRTYFMSKNYFCSLFKNVTGESFMDYLTVVRMEQAKRLLLDCQLTAYEIAELVGYKDQRYFSQVFRKATGMQPTQFRQQSKAQS